jgi:hypothetical protein
LAKSGRRQYNIKEGTQRKGNVTENKRGARAVIIAASVFRTMPACERMITGFVLQAAPKQSSASAELRVPARSNALGE